MSLKKKTMVIIVILQMCLLCFCTKGGNNLNINLAPSDKTIVDLSSKIYEDSQLSEIIRKEAPINEMNDSYPIECIRKKDDRYRVSYLGNEKVAMVWFDDGGGFMMGHVYDAALPSSVFDKMKKGQTLEDVMSIDPDGKYYFLYTGRDDTPRVSYHCTNDGYLFTIEYDENNAIISITKECI